MATQGAFQTHRQYSTQGQRVGFCHLTGSYYVFCDVDRMIQHVVKLPDDHMFYPPGLFKQKIMLQYDRLGYVYEREEGEMYRAAVEVARKHAESL